MKIEVINFYLNVSNIDFKNIFIFFGNRESQFSEFRSYKIKFYCVWIIKISNLIILMYYRIDGYWKVGLCFFQQYDIFFNSSFKYNLII